MTASSTFTRSVSNLDPRERVIAWLRRFCALGR